MTQRNIVLIMSDQQRFDTIKAWGNETMITPNLDKLVSNSISFRQTYAPGATCVASRAATFTGMYAHNTGAYTFLDWADHRTWVHDLSDAGYFCVNVGKMHFMPTHAQSAFDERIVVENPTTIEQWEGGADDAWGQFLKVNGYERPNHRHQSDPDWVQKYQGMAWDLPEEMHSDVFIGNSAAAWIKSYRGEKPFFLQIGFAGPHEPWDPLQRHIDLYDNVTIPPPITMPNDLEHKPPQHQAHKNFHATVDHESVIDLSDASGEDIAHMRKHYYAKITTIDEQLGGVVDALEEMSYLGNSLIIFCSDHGEMLGDHTLSYKWLMYDPIVRVPMIIKMPSSTHSKKDIHELVSLIDIGPTILDFAGIDPPTYLEGRSLLPYVTDGEINNREFVVCEDNYLIMLRSKTHKLVYYFGQDESEFYDLETDPNEFHNLWQDDKFAEIRALYVRKLLDFLATSNYFTHGYKRTRQQKYEVRWHRDGDSTLHGQSAFMPKPDEY